MMNLTERDKLFDKSNVSQNYYIFSQKNKKVSDDAVITEKNRELLEQGNDAYLEELFIKTSQIKDVKKKISLLRFLAIYTLKFMDKLFQPKIW